jgi:ABC-type polysaccharide/polyol phosphate transport system ATPase subunit
VPDFIPTCRDENVYLNGAIMGMPKREIDAKVDQIVAFSEVESFIDTPLKFYSSGMMVRAGIRSPRPH